MESSLTSRQWDKETSIYSMVSKARLESQERDRIEKVAKLIAKEGKSATLKLPSGEVRLISKNCSSTVGQVGNVGANQKSLGRAGSKRWLGKRPVVRGVVMNPVDHPHGGGEGRAPIGRKKPTTPWGLTKALSKSRVFTCFYYDSNIVLFGSFPRVNHIIRSTNVIQQ
ncbi:hypothetical protein ACS0TY_013925 [Phlomoides rotata]